MMPADIKAGDKTFKKADVWSAVAKEFETPAGKKVLAALGSKEAAYVKTLLGA